METGITPVVDVKPIENRLAILIKRSDSIVVSDQNSFVEARQIQKEWDAYIKDAGFEFDPGIEKVKGALQHLQDQKKKYVDPAKAKRESVRQLADNWAADEKRRAQQEQDAINAENARRARIKADEEKREMERVAAENKKQRISEINGMLKRGEIGKREAARLMKEAGPAEEAAFLSAAATAAETAANPPQVKVKASVPTVAGVKSQTFYFAELTDADAIIHDFLTTKDPQRQLFLRQFITVDSQVVGKFARDTRDNIRAASLLPGVKFWSKG